MRSDDYEIDLLFKDQVYRIIGSAINVSNELGCGFLEAVYQEAMEIEFAENNIPYDPQKKIKINYKERTLDKEYILCFNNIIVEIKAINRITKIEEAQILNYLKATKLPLGLIINFGTTRLEWRRYINIK